MYGLINKIKPQNNEVLIVNRAVNHLLSILNGKSDQALLPTPKDFHLVGSYRRGTKISPLNDVDIFYVIGSAVNRDGTWHTITDCDFIFGPEYYELDGNLSSTKILNLIKSEINDNYPDSEITRNGQVVNLFLASYEVGFDIVPVFEILGGEYFLMPNGRGSAKWMKSNPLKDEEILTRLDSFHNNLLKDTIRIAKYWFRQKRIKSPRPYHLEASAYHIFNSLPNAISTHAEGLAIFLGKINEHNFLNSCPDPTGLSEPITSGLTSEDIRNITFEAYEALNHLQIGDKSFIDYVEG